MADTQYPDHARKPDYASGRHPGHFVTRGNIDFLKCRYTRYRVQTSHTRRHQQMGVTQGYRNVRIIFLAKVNLELERAKGYGYTLYILQMLTRYLYAVTQRCPLRYAAMGHKENITLCSMPITNAPLPQDMLH